MFLADRILVLDAHPGRLREMIEVPLPRPRDATQIASPAFAATKARLEALIHGKEAADEDEPYPAVPLLTDVSDEVE